MFRRRLTFAAPFVVIVACKRPVSDVEGPAVQRIADAAPVADAAPSETVELADAAPVAITEAADAAMRDDARTGASSRAEPRPCGSKGFTCNPPPPRVVARMVNVEVEGGAVVIIVASGHEDGVDMSWKACLLDEHQRCTDGAPLTIRHVAARRTTLVLTSTIDFALRHRSVRLTR